MLNKSLERVIPGYRKNVDKPPFLYPDLQHGSKLLEKLINYIMLDGRKSTARRVVYGALKMMEEKGGDPALEIFYNAMNNVMPKLETRSRRVGGSSYQVPYEVPEDRQKTLALRWITAAARARGERTMTERLANELLDAAGSQGKAFEKKQDAHRMAEANRPFAHYRW
jgi:small subunit ribosomal protein S7